MSATDTGTTPNGGGFSEFWDLRSLPVWERVPARELRPGDLVAFEALRCPVLRVATGWTDGAAPELVTRVEVWSPARCVAVRFSYPPEYQVLRTRFELVPERDPRHTGAGIVTEP